MSGWLAHLCHVTPLESPDLTVVDFLILVDFCESWIASQSKG